MSFEVKMCGSHECGQLNFIQGCSGCCPEYGNAGDTVTAMTISVEVPWNNGTTSTTTADLTASDNVIAAFSLTDFYFKSFRLSGYGTVATGNYVINISTDTYTYSATAGVDSWGDILEDLATQITAGSFATGSYSATTGYLTVTYTTSYSNPPTMSTPLGTSIIIEDVSTSPTAFPNGVYEVTYGLTVEDVYGASRTSVVKRFIPFYCQIEQCLSNLVSQLVDFYGDPTKEGCIDTIVRAQIMMQSLEDFEISNTSDISDCEDLIELLEDICNDECNCYSKYEI